MTTVRRQARALVRQLTTPSPWSISELCGQVGELRARPVVVEPVTTAGATASVRRERDRDVISYRADHHNPDHLIAHELGHLLAGHLDPSDGRFVGTSPDLAGAIAEMNRACSYDSAEERLAETVADLIMATAREHSDRAAATAVAAAKLRGFGEAMR